ncbi:hypothetical protein FBULB1_507 [Fusarium bulbicola]|nr:hypothetical protein FBULB1_507 [Fusarium bulbicola]
MSRLLASLLESRSASCYMLILVASIPFSLAWTSGAGHKKIYDLHQIYGDIVRVAPNELSFGYPEAWEDVMGHRKRGQAENGKDPDF